MRNGPLGMVESNLNLRDVHLAHPCQDRSTVLPKGGTRMATLAENGTRTPNARWRLVTLAAAALTLLTIASAAFAANESYNIVMTDYAYTPDHMTWHVGDTVTIKLTNNATDKTHEIMFGKGDLAYETDSFGAKHPHGWTTKLFDSPGQLHFMMGAKIDELMAAMPMIRFQPKGGTMTFTFTVPDKKGTWQYGCFEENGSHFTDHNMKGTIEIVD